VRETAYRQKQHLSGEEAARRFRRRLIFGAITAGSGALFAGLILVAPTVVRIAHEFKLSTSDKLTDPKKTFDFFAEELGPLPKIVAWLLSQVGLIPDSQTAVAIIACLVGVATALTTRVVTNWPRSLQERFFAPFDDRVLSKIRAPSAIDPLRGRTRVADERASDIRPLEWFRPMPAREGEQETYRWRMWSQLTNFAFEGVEPDGTLFSRRPITPFRYTVIFGANGYGKSRFAVEFARALAHRRVFGDSARLAAKRGRLSHIWLWFKFQGLHPSVFGQVRASDPWDAGWLAPEQHRADPALDWTERAEAGASSWIKDLRNWRPRRPTILLMDDPKSAIDFALVLDALSRATGEDFSHPVRLMFVSPDQPASLGISIGNDGEWRSAKLAPFSAPVIFDDRALMSVAEIRRAGAGVPEIDNAEALERFWLVTGGMPLFVELGFDYLRRGRKLAEMSRDVLTDERAERLYQALSRAGSSSNGRAALAVACVAAGAYVPTLKKFGFAISDDEIAGLKLALPTYDWADNYIPPIRPEAIALALARRVVDDRDCSESGAASIVHAAWKVGAFAMLRAAQRLGGRRVGGQLTNLGRLLARPPDALSLGLEAADLAMAYALNGASISRIDWAAGDYAIGVGLEPTAHELVARLSGDEAFNFADGFLRKLFLNGEGRVLRPAVANRLAAAALRRALSSDWPQSAELLETFLTLWSFLPRTWDFRPGFKDAMSADLGATIGDAFIRISKGEDSYFAKAYALARGARFAWKCARKAHDCAIALDDLARHPRNADAGSMNRKYAALIYRFGTYLAEQQVFALPTRTSNDETVERERAFAWRHVVWAYAQTPDAEECERAADRVDTIARPFMGKEEFEKERAEAWRHVGWAYAQAADTEECERAADRVDTIARPFIGKEEFEKERAEAWRQVAWAYAHAPDAEKCKRAADHVDMIAQPFMGKEEFEKERAGAWRDVAWVYTQAPDAEECERAADRVDTIAEPFMGKEEFEKERAEAWRDVAWAYAHAPDAEECKRAADRVDTIARPFIGKEEFEKERADAWRQVGWAYAQAADAEECKRAADHVDTIARPFMGKEEFEKKRAEAWRDVAWAYAQAPVAEECERAADRVDTIARPFIGKEEFEKERAEAWRQVAWAYAHAPDAEKCKRAADRVDTIARPFMGKEEFEKERAEAWRQVAWAYAHAPDAEECKRAADHVDVIVRPFMGKEEFEKKRAEAWRDVASAYAHAPDAEECRRAADRVDTIARPFTGKEEFEKKRAEAWRDVASAYSELRDAENCERSTDVVDAIASRFVHEPSSRTFEEERARAHLGMALCHRALGNFAKSERAAILICQIADRFDHEPPFAEIARKVKSYGR
jgi:hypothetical protein